MAMATTMMQNTPNAATLVRNPTIRPKLPKNSVMITRNASADGTPIFSVNMFIVPLKPYPPNHPNNFWAPCGNMITPSITRKMSSDQESCVANNFLITFSFRHFSAKLSFRQRRKVRNLSVSRAVEVRLHETDARRKNALKHLLACGRRSEDDAPPTRSLVKPRRSRQVQGQAMATYLNETTNQGRFHWLAGFIP